MASPAAPGQGKRKMSALQMLKAAKKAEMKRRESDVTREGGDSDLVTRDGEVRVGNTDQSQSSSCLNDQSQFHRQIIILTTQYISGARRCWSGV